MPRLSHVPSAGREGRMGLLRGLAVGQRGRALDLQEDYQNQTLDLRQQDLNQTGALGLMQNRIRMGELQNKIRKEQAEEQFKNMTQQLKVFSDKSYPNALRSKAYSEYVQSTKGDGLGISETTFNPEAQGELMDEVGKLVKSFEAGNIDQKTFASTAKEISSQFKVQEDRESAQEKFFNAGKTETGPQKRAGQLALHKQKATYDRENEPADVDKVKDEILVQFAAGQPMEDFPENQKMFIEKHFREDKSFKEQAFAGWASKNKDKSMMDFEKEFRGIPTRQITSEEKAKLPSMKYNEQIKSQAGFMSSEARKIAKGKENPKIKSDIAAGRVSQDMLTVKEMEGFVRLESETATMMEYEGKYYWVEPDGTVVADINGWVK